jgi:hypothetical protein
MPFEFLRKMLWGDTNQFSNQFNKLISWKDPYDPSKGTEDFQGYVSRFIGNFDLYINKRLLQIINFTSESDYTIRPGIGFLFIVISIIALFFCIRKRKKYSLFVFLYSGALLFITFFAIQTRWDQLRLILVFIPLIFIFLFDSLYPSPKKISFLKTFVLCCLMSLIFFSSFISSLKSSAKNLPIVKENIKGDMYFGYTEDWKNYLKMSKWCADNLPEHSFVAVRKAPMSFIYGNGKSFFPIYQADYTDPDSALKYLKVNGVTHIVLASLRRNPKKQDGYIINTIHRIVEPIARKYPDKLTLIRQEGITEPSYLYKINY